MVHAYTYVTNWISILAQHTLIRVGMYAFTLMSLSVFSRNIVELFREDPIAKIDSSNVSLSRTRNSQKSIASPVPIAFDSSQITLQTSPCADFF